LLDGVYEAAFCVLKSLNFHVRSLKALMNAQHLQLHVAHHEIYTKKTVLFIGKNRQRSCIANFEATLSMRSSNASTRRHQCTLSVRFFPFSEATPDRLFRTGPHSNAG
jgi:hypothetical protein